jgi:hypothetical protein
MARLKTSDLPDDASEIFLPEGLDTISENQPVGQIASGKQPRLRHFTVVRAGRIARERHVTSLSS